MQNNFWKFLLVSESYCKKNLWPRLWHLFSVIVYMVQPFFHNLLFFRIRTWFTNTTNGNQTWRTAFAKSSIFIWNKTIWTPFTWVFVTYYFIWFAFWAGSFLTIWKWTFRTFFAVTIVIDYFPLYIWTWFAFSSIRTMW